MARARGAGRAADVGLGDKRSFLVLDELFELAFGLAEILDDESQSCGVDDLALDGHGIFHAWLATGGGFGFLGVGSAAFASDPGATCATFRRRGTATAVG